MTQGDRISRLEQTIAKAQLELQALKDKTAPPSPPPPKSEGARVIAINDERTDGLPNFAEMRMLYAVVKHRVPEEKSRDPDAALRGFMAAYRYIANCGRTAAPNSKLAIGYWLDDMKTWLRARKRYVE